MSSESFEVDPEFIQPSPFAPGPGENVVVAEPSAHLQDSTGGEIFADCHDIDHCIAPPNVRRIAPNMTAWPAADWVSSIKLLEVLESGYQSTSRILTQRGEG